MVAKVSGTEGVDLVKDGTLVVTDAKTGQPVGFQKMQLIAAQSASGTVVDFTDIPSWAKRVTVMLYGVSTNGTSPVLIRLGAGAVVADGYAGSTTLLGSSTIATETTTLGLKENLSYSAAAVRHGSATFYLAAGGTWTGVGQWHRSDSSQGMLASTSIDLGGVLDRIRLTTVNGTDTFDAGSVSILVEGYE